MQPNKAKSQYYLWDHEVPWHWVFDFGLRFTLFRLFFLSENIFSLNMIHLNLFPLKSMAKLFLTLTGEAIRIITAIRCQVDCCHNRIWRDQLANLIQLLLKHQQQFWFVIPYNLINSSNYINHDYCIAVPATSANDTALYSDIYKAFSILYFTVQHAVSMKSVIVIYQGSYTLLNQGINSKLVLYTWMITSIDCKILECVKQPIK